MRTNRFLATKVTKAVEPFQKNFANLANVTRAKKISPHSTRIYTFCTSKITTNYHTHERNTYMKLEIDWFEMAKAVAKAIWPFIAGAFGGLFSGCTFGGIGPNFI